MIIYRFVCDKHVSAPFLAPILTPATVTPAAERQTRYAYVGADQHDEDRAHVLQLAFERDATLLTADDAMLEKAYNFGPCGSRNHRLGGVIVLPPGKDQQIRSFADGTLRIPGVDAGDFAFIWRENLGIDLRSPHPSAVDMPVLNVQGVLNGQARGLTSRARSAGLLQTRSTYCDVTSSQAPP